MTWYGDYQHERWGDAVKACEDFFRALDENQFYKLVEKEDVTPSEYRYAFRAAYFDRGTTETLIPVHRNIYKANNNPLPNHQHGS